jgi:hypothetical protein
MLLTQPSFFKINLLAVQSIYFSKLCPSTLTTNNNSAAPNSSCVLCTVTISTSSFSLSFSYYSCQKDEQADPGNFLTKCCSFSPQVRASFTSLLLSVSYALYSFSFHKRLDLRNIALKADQSVTLLTGIFSGLKFTLEQSTKAQRGSRGISSALSLTSALDGGG